MAPLDGALAADLSDLAETIYRIPIIDNHAHSLLKPEALSRYPLMSITTEANGDAIHAAWSSLAHIRAIKQLSKVLRCDGTWEAIVSSIEHRRMEDPDGWTQRCLHGIETILIDDGLDSPDDVHEYTWHDGFTRAKCKRIMRIENIAAKIIDRHCASRTESDTIKHVFEAVMAEFHDTVTKALADPEVVAFKSIICYRTGLDIPKTVDMASARDSFMEIVDSYAELEGGFKRLQHASLNHLFVHTTADLVRDCKAPHKKPIQFHTGLGDNDITLTSASPSHLQEFIRCYPTVPIVLLHASYPFTREAGYLASVYANVYADIGEVFPFLSQDGQERVLRDILELCPWSKILWSTDGHWFPETYLLAVMQVREALERVLCEYVRRTHISPKAARHLAKDILFNNSNRLYNLGLPYDVVYPLDEPMLGVGAESTDLEVLQHFLKFQPGCTPQFVRISWVDYTASPRCRLVPMKKVTALLEAGEELSVGITKASLGLLQNDRITPGWTATGEYRLHPDFSSLKWGPHSQVCMYGDFREQNGDAAVLCPRTQLRRVVSEAAADGLSFLLGFEIEFILLKRHDPTRHHEPVPTLIASPSNSHSWSLARSMHEDDKMALFGEMVLELEGMGIDVELVHAESAAGQYELVLPPRPPLEAVDTLLHTREVMAVLASRHGFRMSLHPKPFPKACGTAAHMHISIASAASSPKMATPTDPAVYEPFYAGILRHLGAIAAFTYSNPASYERVVPGAWAGGQWVAWGTQNRETPLRKIAGSHWELKCMDGLANPYLAVAAALGAGHWGLRSGERLAWGDCEIDPALLTDNDRHELGVTEMLPLSLNDALQRLADDELLQDVLGQELVERYTAVKVAEVAMLDLMSVDEKRDFLLERY